MQKHGQEITPKEIQTILESIEGLPNEPQISRLTLRTMKQAKYTTECSGHFGLAAKYYCHFTSPIRRYPDLQIHRIIKECLHGGMSEKRKLHYDKILPDVAEQASATERRASAISSRRLLSRPSCLTLLPAIIESSLILS